jgi:hypothetical protein
MASTVPLVAERFVSGEVDIGDIGRNEKGKCEGKTTISSGGPGVVPPSCMTWRK